MHPAARPAQQAPAGAESWTRERMRPPIVRRRPSFLTLPCGRRCPGAACCVGHGSRPWLESAARRSGGARPSRSPGRGAPDATGAASEGRCPPRTGTGSSRSVRAAAGGTCGALVRHPVRAGAAPPVGADVPWPRCRLLAWRPSWRAGCSPVVARRPAPEATVRSPPSGNRRRKCRFSAGEELNRCFTVTAPIRASTDTDGEEAPNLPPRTKAGAGCGSSTRPGLCGGAPSSSADRVQQDPTPSSGQEHPAIRHASRPSSCETHAKQAAPVQSIHVSQGWRQTDPLFDADSGTQISSVPQSSSAWHGASYPSGAVLPGCSVSQDTTRGDVTRMHSRHRLSVIIGERPWKLHPESRANHPPHLRRQWDQTDPTALHVLPAIRTRSQPTNAHPTSSHPSSQGFAPQAIQSRISAISPTGWFPNGQGMGSPTMSGASSSFLTT